MPRGAAVGSAFGWRTDTAASCTFGNFPLCLAREFFRFSWRPRRVGPLLSPRASKPRPSPRSARWAAALPEERYEVTYVRVDFGRPFGFFTVHRPSRLAVASLAG